MTRHIYVDRTDAGGFTVRILSGARGDRTHKFTDRKEALAFAESKMGRSGMIADTTLMTDEQLKAHRAREARARALLAEMKP
jgi:hypothetical protein